jgi:hypothetical protein
MVSVLMISLYSCTAFIGVAVTFGDLIDVVRVVDDVVAVMLVIDIFVPFLKILIRDNCSHIKRRG